MQHSLPGPRHRRRGRGSPRACWLAALLSSRLRIQKQKRLFSCYFSGELLSCSLSSTHLRAGMAAVPFLFKQSVVEAILEKERNSCKNNFCLGKCCCQQRHKENWEQKLLPPGRGGSSKGCSRAVPRDCDLPRAAAVLLGQVSNPKTWTPQDTSSNKPH